MLNGESHDLIESWSASLAASDCAPRTRRRYLAVVRNFVDWFEQQNHEVFRPARLTPIDLVGYRTALQHEQAASSVNVQVCALRGFCAWLTETYQLGANPAARLKAVGRTAPLGPKSLRPAQVNALLREAKLTRHPDRDYAIIQLLLQTGMRIGELAALRVGDLEISERQGQVTIRAGKGNRYRVVPVNTSARQALATYLAPLWGVAPTVKAVAASWPQSDTTSRLWHSQKGSALSIRAISAMVSQLVVVCAQRGLVPVDTSAHTLRHTFATLYLRDHPGDLVGLATLLGHSTLETTRIYVQPTAADLAERVESMRLNAFG